MKSNKIKINHCKKCGKEVKVVGWRLCDRCFVEEQLEAYSFL